MVISDLNVKRVDKFFVFSYLRKFRLVVIILPILR